MKSYIFWLCLFLGAVGNAFDHHEEIVTNVRIFANRLDVVVRTRPSRAWIMLGEDAPAEITAEAFESSRAKFAKLAGRLFVVSDGGTVLQPRKVNTVLEINNMVAFVVTYPSPEKWPLRLSGVFAKEQGPDFVGSLAVFDLIATPFARDEQPMLSKMLTNHNYVLEVPNQAAAVPTATPETPKTIEKPKPSPSPHEVSKLL